MPSSVELRPVVLEKEDENVKSLHKDRKTDGQTTGDKKSSLELSAHVSYKPIISFLRIKWS